MRDEAEARKIAQAQLDDPKEYQPGGKITRIAPLEGVTISSWGGR